MKYRDLSDTEWRRISRLLPLDPGAGRRPHEFTRKHLNGMLYVLQAGRPWREMDPKYGKWNSVYVRFRRWAEKGVWDLLIAELVSLGRTDRWHYATSSEAAGRHSEGALTREAKIKTALFDAVEALKVGQGTFGSIRRAALGGDFCDEALARDCAASLPDYPVGSHQARV